MLHRKYNKPAIQEAIFEARFLEDKYGSTLPGQVFERVKHEYPKKRDILLNRVVPGNINTPQTIPQLIQQPIMQAWKEDGSSLIQVGPGIAVANQLKYSGWENFVPNIRTILNAYITIAEPKYLSKLSIRYINRFLIPEENINPSEYFRFSIQVPETFQKTHSFGLTLLHKIAGLNKSNLEFEVKIKFITDSLRPGEAGSCFVLDIECYLNAEFDPDLEQIINVVTQEHDVIENLFENIITDNVRNIMEVQK